MVWEITTELWGERKIRQWSISFKEYSRLLLEQTGFKLRDDVPVPHNNTPAPKTGGPNYRSSWRKWGRVWYNDEDELLRPLHQ